MWFSRREIELPSGCPLDETTLKCVQWRGVCSPANRVHLEPFACAQTLLCTQLCYPSSFLDDVRTHLNMLCPRRDWDSESRRVVTRFALAMVRDCLQSTFDSASLFACLALAASTRQQVIVPVEHKLSTEAILADIVSHLPLSQATLLRKSAQANLKWTPS